MTEITHPGNRVILSILNEAKKSYIKSNWGLCSNIAHAMWEYLGDKIPNHFNGDMIFKKFVISWIPEFWGNRPNKDRGFKEYWWTDPRFSFEEDIERTRYLDMLIGIYETKVLKDSKRSGLGIIPLQSSSFPIDPQCP